MNRSDLPLPDDAPWVVLKFGGTSVSTRPRWDNIASIAATHREAGKRVLIVVSALSGITDLLKGIGEGHADEARCTGLRETIVARHHGLFGELGLAKRNAIDAWLARLDQLLADPRRGTGDLPWQAELLALGWDEILESPGVVVAEWADKFPDLFPAETVWLRFSIDPDGARRVGRRG